MTFSVIFSPKNMKGKFCREPWDTVNILENGDVYSCTCSVWTNIVIGNMFDQSLSEIYASSPRLKLLRDSTLSGSYSWCIEKECTNLRRLPNCGSDPLAEFGVDSNIRLPTNLVLAIDKNCNLKCISCRPNKIFSNQSDPRVSTILNKLAVDYENFDRPVSVMLDGHGDVFVSEAYDDLLFSGNMPACWKLNITTNGNLLTKKKDKIASIASKIDMVTISLDAATTETYAIIRGGNFALVVEGIKMLLGMKVDVYLQFVLQQANYSELLAYKNLANSLNVSYGVQKIDRWAHMTEEYWQQANIENNPAVDAALLKEQLLILSKDPSCNLDGGTQWLLSRL